MDQALNELMGDKDGVALRVLDGDGNIEIGKADDMRAYTLKPLSELYGLGVNAATIVPDSPEYISLFQPVEGEIVRCWQINPDLTDGQVSLALDRLAMSPEAPTDPDSLARSLQVILRLVLSIRDFSRKDVQRSLRYLNKSVARHTRSGGRQGYLEFIRRFV